MSTNMGDKQESIPNISQLNDQPFEIVSPMTGTVVRLQDIKDETFAGEHMGKGIAIRPTNGRVISPVNGIVQTIYRTKHAIGLISDDGVEILIHIGQDTVQLKGQHFNAFVKDGDRVQVGDVIVETKNDMVNEKEHLIKVYV
ncbi:PTS glucose transporter subunit IIA [Paenibacillus sp. OT2-17]|uniref:PTS sugar transporter subunit IIA n=1 Tax=Paenibacillus sp. OT2-17 TaxID=2691605 RepID=UPI001F25CF29|nr:PTS glucose transporter subunit IIA [Paenibacillus sp. OT2-17]